MNRGAVRGRIKRQRHQRDHQRYHQKTKQSTHLGNVPLHPIRHHPSLPQRRPVPLAHRVLLLVVHRRKRRAVVHPRLARDDHVALQAPEHRAAHHRRPRVHWLHHLDRPDVLRRGRGGVRRPLAVRGRRRARKVRLEPPVQVVALPEAAHQHDTRHDAALGSEALHLALHQIAHFLDHRLKNFLDLLRTHHHEARIEASLFVIRETGEAAVVSVRDSPALRKQALTGR